MDFPKIYSFSDGGERRDAEQFAPSPRSPEGLATALSRVGERVVRQLVDGECGWFWSRFRCFVRHVFELRDGAFDEEVKRPVDHDADLGAEADHLGEVKRSPDKPADEAGELDAQKVHRLVMLTDRKQRPEVEILKWFDGLTTQEMR